MVFNSIIHLTLEKSVNWEMKDAKKFCLYSRGSLEETKSWLRKLIRRKALNESRATEYKAIVEKLGPKLNAFINSTKARSPRLSESDGGQA